MKNIDLPNYGSLINRWKKSVNIIMELSERECEYFSVPF